MPLENTQIFISRRYEHAPDVVFAHWTDADLLRTWWAPPGYRVDAAEMNPVVGGQWRVSMSAETPPTRLTVVGEVQSIEQPERLVLTWAWEREEGNSPSSIVEVLFQADGNGTKLEIAHSGIIPDAAIPQHKAGWECSVAQLAVRLENA